MDKVWQEGYDAYQKGKSESANPYEVGTDDAMSWFDGWMAADTEYEELDEEDEEGEE